MNQIDWLFQVFLEIQEAWIRVADDAKKDPIRSIAPHKLLNIQ